MLKIEFEGTDGAGKTTGLKYFIERAQSLGYSVVETREVGNPNVPSCVKMREFVLDPANNLRGETMEMIFSAMRFENDKWLRSINTEPNGPSFVVSDRGWYSHLAYTDHNVSEEFTAKLYDNLLAKTTLLPDVVIYFSVNTETALSRRIKRGTGMDAIEMKGIEFQEKVRKSFQKYLNVDESLETVKVFYVDANQDIEGVRRQLDDILGKIVGRKVNEAAHRLMSDPV